MNITVIDGHGGMLGAQIVREIVSRFESVSITAIGTNASKSCLAAYAEIVSASCSRR